MASESRSKKSYPINTVVVLVQENRSFDHMLGWMKSLNPEIDGVDGTQSNPISTAGGRNDNDNNNSNAKRIFFRDGAAYVDPDPGHSFQAIYEQVFGEEWSEGSAGKKLPAAMQGFAQNAERTAPGLAETVMNGFGPDSVPVFKDLVSEFAVCDRWFASVPAATQPNRLFVHSATSHGMTGNDTKQLIQGFPQKTIFESLHEEGHSFGIYYEYPASTFFYRNLRKLKYIKHFHQFSLHFKKHCEEGTLPNYVVIEPRYFDLLSIPANDDHPSHDVSEGQRFVKEVYEALRASPQWDEMLFVVVYDEHGGFYDHVPTPIDGIPSPDGIVGEAPYNFHFDRLGVRVPAILISPWIERGTVLHEPSGPHPTSQFEHSSIAATVKKIFNLKHFLTKRDEWAGTFESVFLTRTTPRTDCPATLSEPVKLRDHGAREEAQISEFQAELVQMTATLNGDLAKDIFPLKLVESLTVSEAVKYCHGAFETFFDECEKAKQSGFDDSKIFVCVASESTSPPKRPKSVAHKIFSCLICDN